MSRGPRARVVKRSGPMDEGKRVHWTLDPRWNFATGLLLVLLAGIGVATIGDYGLSWDLEHVQEQGERIITWYTSGFSDRRILEEGNYWLYGGLVVVPALLADRLVGVGPFEMLRVFSTLFGWLGVATAGWLGARLGGPLAGFLSALLLATTPVYYGHAFTNPRDLPFAVLSLIALAVIVRTWPDPERVTWSSGLLAGLAIGLAMSVRVAGLIGFFSMGLAWAGAVACAAAGQGWSRAVQLARRLERPALWSVVAAWLLCLVWWPYAQTDPLLGPIRVAFAHSRILEWMGPLKFMGRTVYSENLPWNYAPVWFGITLPEVYFFAALVSVAGLVAWALACRRRPFVEWALRPPVILAVMLVAAVAVPLLLVITRGTVLYDGIRHLLFVVPPLAVGLGWGTAAALQRIRRPALAWATLGLVLVLVARAALDMVALHPYQGLHFNRLFGGGLAGGARSFETDYWGLSYREGVEWLLANPPAAERPLRVANCSNTFLSGYFVERARDDRFVSVFIREPRDIMLATTRYDCHKRVKGRLLHVVERMGVPLTYVFDVRAADGSSTRWP